MHKYNYFLISFIGLLISPSFAFSQSAPNCLDLRNKTIDQQIDSVMYIANNNDNMKSSFESQYSKLYDLRSEQLYFIPSLELTNSWSFNESEYSYSQHSYLPYTESWTENSNNQLNASLNWNFFNISQLYSISASDNIYNLQKQITLSDLQQNAIDTSTAYIQYLLDSELSKNTLKLIDVYTKQHQDIQEKYQRGLASKIDLLNSSQQLDSYTAQYNTNLSKITKDINNLSTLIDLDLCSFNSVDSFPDNLNKYKLYPNSYQAALLLSPYLNQLQYQKNNYNALSKSKYYSYLPILSLSATSALTTTYQKSPSILTSTDNDYSILGTITWNFFDGGINIMSAKSYEKQASKSDLLIKYSSEKLKNSVSSLEDQLESTYKNIDVYSLGLSKQQSLLSLTLIGYQAGFLTSTDLQTATSTYINSLNDKSTAIYDYLSNKIQYQSLFLFPDYPQTHSQLIEHY